MGTMTRVRLSMISVPRDTQTGSSVVYDGINDLIVRDPNEVSPIQKGAFDSETGTLRLIRANQTEVIVPGFLTNYNVPPGPIGPTGLPGQMGITGRDGIDGKTGPQGCRGLKGDPGPPGDVGDSGPMGPTGPVGPAGPVSLCSGDGGTVDLGEILARISERVSREGDTVNGDLVIKEVCYARAFISTSSIKHKENVQDLTIDYAESLIRALTPVSFDWITSKTFDTGFIAEDLPKVAGHLYWEHNGVVGVKYISLISPMIKTIQSLLERVDDLTASLNVQERLISMLNAQLKKIS